MLRFHHEYVPKGDGAARPFDVHPAAGEATDGLGRGFFDPAWAACNASNNCDQWQNLRWAFPTAFSVQGINVGMVDGSSRKISPSITWRTWILAHAFNDGQAIAGEF